MTSIGMGRHQYEESKLAFDDKFEENTMNASTVKTSKKGKYKAAKADPIQHHGAFSHREPEDIYEGLKRESVFF